MNKTEELYDSIMSSLSEVVISELKKIYTIQEGVESKMSLSDVMNVIAPYGWSARRNGVRYIVSKGSHTVTFHIKHDKSQTLDVGGLDQLRTELIDEYNETHDSETINNIPWKKWHLPDPFNRELKDYDRITGELKTTPQIEEPVELTRTQKMNQARADKRLQKYNELYKDIALIKIDYNDPDSAYIMIAQDERNNKTYNICRSEDDRRPLLKVWMDNQRREDGIQYLGKIDWRNYTMKYYEVHSDGTVEKKVAMVLDESFNGFNN